MVAVDHVNLLIKDLEFFTIPGDDGPEILLKARSFHLSFKPLLTIRSITSEHLHLLHI